jgi:hypothetical protein
MNAFVLIAVALAILFGAPALVGSVRKAAARYAAARAQRAADAEQAREALKQLWTHHPETAGVGETLSYKARAQVGLMQESLEQHRKLDQRDEKVQHRQRHIRDGNPVTPGYRLRVLAGLALFLIVFVLGIGLDYLVFRGLHPTGTWLLPLALACLAVIGITAGSVLFLDATRHHLVHATATPYARRVVALGGAMLAAGITVYMIVIAPYRSAPAGEARISQAQQQLASDQSQILAGGGSNSQLITADKQTLARARTDLAQAQRVDRWSAAVLAVLDIPLSEAGFLGAELLLLDLAVFRCQRARRRTQRADNALQRADNAFIDALHQILTRHGHTKADEVIPRIIARVNRLGPGTRSPSIGGQPTGTGQAGDASGKAGQASPPGSGRVFPTAGMPQPPGGGLGGAGSPGAVSIPEFTIIHPNGGKARPSTGSVNGNLGGPSSGPVPEATLTNPNGGPSRPSTGPVNGPPDPQADRLGAGGAMTPPAELPPEEFDMTA